MKTKSNRFLALASLASAILTFSALAATRQWDGGANTDNWSDGDNWNPNIATPYPTGFPPFNTTASDRLNVNGTQALTYTVNEGTTNYGSSGTGSDRGLVIGSGTAGSGTMNITGGTFSSLNAGTNLDIIGNSTGNTGTLNISGGTFIGASGGTSMNLGGAFGSGRVSNLNLSGSGTATLTNLILNGVTININLNGGLLELKGFTNTSIQDASKIRFNGGTLKALQDNAGFLTAAANLETLVQSGGAVIDTNGFNITIAEALLEDSGSTGGGLTKNGAGLLTLGAISTVTGDVSINAGGLAIKGDSSNSWYPDSFSHSGDTLNFDLGSASPSNPAPIDTVDLTVSSAITVNIAGTDFSVGQFPLINYDNKSITGSLSLNTATLPTGVLATLVDDNAGQIYLDVTQAATIYEWFGAASTPGTGDWDTISSNWNLNADTYSTATPQITNFPNIIANVPGDPNTVNLTGAYSPLTLNITNLSGNPYVFTGTGKLTGPTLINKSGTGIATFASGTNDYTGATTISGGALIRQAADSTTGNITVTGDNMTFALDAGVADGAGQTIHIQGRGATGANYFYLGSAVQRGALQSLTGSNTWHGDVVLSATGSIATPNRIGAQDGASLTLTGMVSESNAGSVLLFRTGTLGSNITLGGSGTYTYTGETQIFSGGGSVILGNDNKLPTGKLLNLTSNGSTVFDLNGYDQETAGIYGGAFGTGATITNNGSGPSVLTCSPPVATSNTCNALITDGTNTVSLVKNGDGTQKLGYLNTYTGSTTVSAGTLLINGNQSGATGAVQVNGGILGGTGIIGGAVTVGPLGTISPGENLGTLTVDSADLSSGGTLAIGIDDAGSPTSDLLAVTNTLNVTDAKLVLTVTGTPTASSYVIATATTITGTIVPANVTGLPSGYILVQTGTEIRLDQAAGSPYETWGDPYGLAEGSEGGDLDNDGLTNFEEFAFGLIPNNGSSVNPITAQLDKATRKFTYQRLAASGLTYTIWTSPNLGTWTEDTTATQLATPAGANETVVVTLTGPLPADKLFVRVKAQ